MLLFLLNSLFLGLALAMDAFSLSVANALSEKNILLRKIFAYCVTFAFFQFIMPLIGWFCLHFFLSRFMFFLKFVPWISLTILSFLGIKMIVQSLSGEEEVRDEKLCEKSAEVSQMAEKAQSDWQKQKSEQNQMAEKAVQSQSFGQTPPLQSSLSSVESKTAKTFSVFWAFFLTLLFQGLATSLDALSVGFTIVDYNFHMALICSLIIAAVTFLVCFFGFFLGKKVKTIKNLRAELFGGIILILIGIEIFVKGIFFA